MYMAVCVPLLKEIFSCLLFGVTKVFIPLVSAKCKTGPWKCLSFESGRKTVMKGERKSSTSSDKSVLGVHIHGI